MKLLKQILIFCVFTAAIYGVFALVTAPKTAFDKSSLRGSNVDQISEEITTDWAGKTQWDADVYNREMTMIAQSRASNLINDDARKSLYDRVNKEAYTRITSAMNGEFARRDADEAVLAANYDGLMTVATREPGVERVPEVADVESVYSLYNRVKQFCGRSFAMKPRFNAADGSWAPSFPAMERNARATRDNLVGNRDFASRLSHIDEMKKIHQTDAKLADARSKYYDDLAAQIESHYREAAAACDPATDQLKDLKDKLQAVRSAVYNETSGNHPINNRLRSLVNSL